MNPALSEFLDKAQLDSVLGFVAAFARALLAADTERTKTSIARKIATIIGSVALAIVSGYVVASVDGVKKWAPLAALATGLLAQDILMRITRRSQDILDAAENKFTPKLSQQRRPRNDDDYYR